MMLIRRYEELSMNAWPALQTHIYDGWIIRFANGITKRANSINPIYDSTMNMQSKIDYCESLYTTRNLPIVYKLTPNDYSKPLDMMLQNRGYRVVDTTSLQVLDITSIDNIDSKIDISSSCSDEWLENFMRLSHKDMNTFSDYKKIFMQLNLPACYVSIQNHNDTIGCGLGVLQDGHIGIFDIVISTKYRKQGNGTKIVNAILNYAKEKQATKAYLQVVTSNQNALNLYSKLGFTEIYQYWYRVKD